jgi:hypothetical protein
MGFLSPLKAIGKGLNKLPGAKTLNKPINKALGQTPGLKGVPKALGMAGPSKTRAPIAPTPAAANSMVQDKAAANVGPPSVASPIGAAPPMSAPPQMSPPPQMTPQYEAPEAVMGAQEAMMQPPPQMMPPQQPQFDPSALMQKMSRGNTGVMGGRNGPIARRPSGIGPRFMG